jgi:hypothetical protein
LDVALAVLFFCVEEWVECRREKDLRPRIEEYVLGMATSPAVATAASVGGKRKVKVEGGQ